MRKLVIQTPSSIGPSHFRVPVGAVKLELSCFRWVLRGLACDETRHYAPDLEDIRFPAVLSRGGLLGHIGVGPDEVPFFGGLLLFVQVASSENPHTSLLSQQGERCFDLDYVAPTGVRYVCFPLVL